MLSIFQSFGYVVASPNLDLAVDLYSSILSSIYKATCNLILLLQLQGRGHRRRMYAHVRAATLI